MKNIFCVILLGISLLLSCSTEESIEPVTQAIPTPETFGDWSPGFDIQTANFTQTRTGSKGTEQSRAINVTSSIEINNTTDETNLNQDINSDGDTIDMYNEITTTYSASESLGSHSLDSIELLFNQDANIINSNTGFWAGAYNSEDYYGYVESNGNLIYNTLINGFNLFQDYPETCYSLIDAITSAEELAYRINNGGFPAFEDSYELLLSSSVAYVGLNANIPADNLFTQSYLESWELDYVNNFDVWSIYFRWTNVNGVEFISYYDIFYDSERNYQIGPWGNEDEIIDWAENSDIFDWAFLSNNSQTAADIVNAAEICDTGKNNNSKSINFSNNYQRKLNESSKLREKKSSSSSLVKGYSKTSPSNKSFAKSVHEDLKKLNPINQKINLKLNK